jgi:3-oxoacyl-[acyl-carrier protein] reductase
MARVFAAAGARVVVADLDGANASRVAADLAACGSAVMPVQIDITDPTSVERMVCQTLAEFGQFDILVNNAGIGSNEPFLTMTLDEWNRNLEVNLTGTFLCAQAAARVMVQRGGGKIVNVASISGQRGGQGREA